LLDQINRIRHDVPLVLADAYAANADFDNVTVDNSYGVLCIIEHLVKLGHGRIGFIGDRIVTQERLKSYQKALEHYHITPAEEYIRISQERYEHGGYLRMKELLSLPERPTAVFAVTDNMAIGAMRAAIEMGFSIPDDVSIVGFDDIMVSSYMEVPLTTMLQPKFDIGKLSADLLLGRINAKAGKFVQQVVLRPEMVIRQTTSRAKNTSDHPSPEPRRT
jgi:DNA-binding LacI/PurR family transcriptional regulator